MSTIARPCRGAALALALFLASPSAVDAQDPNFGAPPAEGASEGKPIFGYLAVGAGCIAIMFVLCISARR
ncbi:hypothetical protein [Tautonia plasticadhaerens]|uniref:Uncharacterized protein n=1 Tax=Tautonia plasticadhaerens TaxID=2527974 RepID=A0A518H8D7_9BACT|nr:hypothetical protein [Tautonia plasticadhaerens]QDV37122.1 hypothetical protein ElP_50550 [Tautonia plasticadhaerens]